MSSSKNTIVNKYSSVFSGTGRFKKFKLKLHTDESILPTQQPIRNFPYHTKQNVSLQLLSLDIIERVEGTTWLNPIAVVPKPASYKMSLCLNMREANRAIIRERHAIPKIEDLLTELHGATVFSK